MSISLRPSALLILLLSTAVGTSTKSLPPEQSAQAGVSSCPTISGASSSGAATPCPEAGITWIAGPASDHDRLGAWRAGVGPAVTLTGDGDHGAPSLRDLALISWNTNVGGGDLHGLLADLRAGRLTGGDSVTHFVLLLQEVYRAGTDVPRGVTVRPRRIAPTPKHGQRSDIVAVAREHGLHLFYVPSMSNGWTDGDAHAEDRGNAILSTLPLSAHTAIELPFEGQRRVAASATVRVRDAAGRVTALRTVSVHLDNRSAFSRVLHSFGSGRARQAESLASSLLRDSAAHLPTVLAGDLNTWAPTPWERAVSVLRTHFPIGNVMRVPTYAGPPMGIGRTLDYMMFRVPVADAASRRRAGPSDVAASDGVSFAPPVSVRLDDARGSDHYPLLARLRLTDRP